MSGFLSGISFLGGSRYEPEEVFPVSFNGSESAGCDLPSSDDVAADDGVLLDTMEGKSVVHTISFMKDGSAHEGELKGAVFITACRTPNGLRAAKKIANLKFAKTGLKEKYRKEIGERLSGKNREGDVYKISFMADGKIFEGDVEGSIYCEDVISKAGIFVAVKMAKKRFKKIHPDIKLSRLYRRNVRDLTKNIESDCDRLLYFIPNEGELTPYGKKVAEAMGTTYFIGNPCNKHKLNNVRYVSTGDCVLCKSKLNI